MTELDEAILRAFASEGKQEDANKVYLTLLRTILFLPTKKETQQDTFQPLFLKADDNYFVMAFDTRERITAWIGDQSANIDVVEMLGKEVIAGLNPEVYFCLNAGSAFYKEFSPDELKRLKKIVERIEQLKN